MRAHLVLLRYLMTWSPPVALLMWLGLALLCIAIVLGLVNQGHTAYGFSIYASILLLGLPYLIAWYPFRVMLASQRLSLLPRFRFQLGIAMLLFTGMLASCIPLASRVFWPGSVSWHLAPIVFAAASLFTFTMQWAVASPYAVAVFSIGPFIVIYALTQLSPFMVLALFREESLIALMLAAALGWGLALHTLQSRRDFRPPGKTPTHAREFVWDGRSDWLGILFGNYKGPVKSAAGTLLLGTPDGFSGRFFGMLNLTLISPMFGLAALYLSGFAPPNIGLNGLASMFLGFSLVASLTLGFGNGELAARCRFVWLRRDGDRAKQWRHLEQRLFADTQLLALIVVPITGVAVLMFDSLYFDPLTYCLSALACNLLGNYFGLAARLSQWSIFVQLLTSGAMTASLIVGRVAGVLSLPVLVATVLGLALLFRHQALQRFAVVDWYQLRPGTQFKSRPS